MMADQQESDWMRRLREQQQDEQPPTPQDLQPQMARADVGEDLQQPEGPVDVMGDLRVQAIQAQESFEEERPPLVQYFRDLEPWKRMILAVLLFLDVALCGCMGLVMVGRVALPF
jgi:hypothetical protein